MLTSQYTQKTRDYVYRPQVKLFSSGLLSITVYPCFLVVVALDSRAIITKWL